VEGPALGVIALDEFREFYAVALELAFPVCKRSD